MNRFVVGAAVVICTVLSSGAPASASTTWRVQFALKPPGVSHATILTGVSCPARGDCTAVGFSHRNGAAFIAAEHWDGTGWAIQPIASLPGTSQAFLEGVSCASATSCTAVGSDYLTTGGEQPLAEHWDGTSWTLEHVPLPASASGQLAAVSCASATSCTAIGGYGTPSAGGLMAEHWDGTSWSFEHVPLPALSDGQLLGVSCPTAMDCIAVGESGGSTSPLAEQWNGSRWTIQTMPRPAGNNITLTGVSCTQPAACTAVGYTSNGALQQTAAVERWNGTRWAIQNDAAPAQTILFGVSCSSAQACTAVGEDVSPTAVAEHWDGTSWTLQPTPQPRSTTTGAGFNGVSCLESSYCTAVGDYAPGGRPLAEHEG